MYTVPSAAVSSFLFLMVLSLCLFTSLMLCSQCRKAFQFPLITCIFLWLFVGFLWVRLIQSPRCRVGLGEEVAHRVIGIHIVSIIYNDGGGLHLSLSLKLFFFFWMGLES